MLCRSPFAPLGEAGGGPPTKPEGVAAGGLFRHRQHVLKRPDNGTTVVIKDVGR